MNDVISSQPQSTNRSRVKRVLVMAGGTGGHVFPALAVAGELRTLGIEVVWMGTRAGLEARLVPEAGYPMEWVTVTGLRGKGPMSWVAAPWRLVRALGEALAAVRRVAPDVVLGMGGFATGPGGLAAWLLRRPLVIHEQNSVAGLTNRLLARLARRVLEAFPDTFPPGLGAVATGNPIRPEIAALATKPQGEDSTQEEAAGEEVGGRPWRLLVLGGSQGAAALNAVLPAALARLPAQVRPEVWHQSGARLLEQTQVAYREAGVMGRIEPFIADMAVAYRWAELVVCRAGALTVAEVAAAGVAAVLVPYPYAVDDHQTYNARLLVNAGAAILLPQRELSPERLAEMLTTFGEDPERLRTMGCSAHTVARPAATAEVVARVLVAGRGLQKQTKPSDDVDATKDQG
ncbi:N-acetylglucosaminyl transferase [Gammaproteobacteria bacterium]